MRLARLSFVLLTVLLLALPALAQSALTNSGSEQVAFPAAWTAAADSRRPAAAPSAASVPRSVTRQLAFTIPFQVTAGSGGQKPAEVRLYVSSDGGATWKLHARQAPDADKFTYRATADGRYLFLVRTIDGRGQMHPGGPAEPELEVMVDTQLPELSLQTSVGPSGEVRAEWSVADPHLAPDSFTLQYQADVNGPWQTLAVQPPRLDPGTGRHMGKTMWWPQTPIERMRVRAQVRDRAGNVAVANRSLEAPRTAARPAKSARPRSPATGQAVADRAPDSGAYPQTPYSEVQPQTVGTPAAGQIADSAAPENPQSDPERAAPKGIRWPAQAEASGPDEGVGRRLAGGGLADGPAADVATSDGKPSGAGALTDTRRYPPRPAEARPAVTRRAGPVTVDTSLPPSGRALQGPTGESLLPRGERPQMTRSRRFQLAYDVEAIGPSGVRRVELWQTRDGGRTWQVVGVDDDNRSPITVEPPEEGIYGYRMVVESGNGLTGRPPRPGDLAEVWIGVDWTRPTAELTSAIYGAAERAGQLEIHWEAADARLADRPVSLLFSDKPTGDWSPIATGLPNDGVYHWRVDERVPTQIYLRLEVRDEAGNLAVHQLQRPIANDGLVPQGRIRGIQPAEDARRGVLGWPSLRR